MAIRADRLSHAETPRPIGRPLIRFDRVTSTMDVATTLADLGSPEGTVIQADLQTAGRGRAGRVWESEAGSALMLSIILRPSDTPIGPGALSLLAGLAVARTAEVLSSRPSTIKWPNDVLLDGLKVSGILVHSRATPPCSCRQFVLGIGVNVRETPESHAARAISLSEAAGVTVATADVLNRLIAELDTVYVAFRRGDIARELTELDARLAFRDQQVSVVDGGRTTSGTVSGIDHTCALLLRLPDGTLRPIISGELTRGPTPVEP